MTTGNAEEDARLDKDCPARIDARKMVEFFLSLNIKEMASQVISELIDGSVADDLTIDKGALTNVLRYAGSKTDADPLLLPSILNVNQWRLGFTLDPRCIACKNIRKAIKDVHEKWNRKVSKSKHCSTRTAYTIVRRCNTTLTQRMLTLRDRRKSAQIAAIPDTLNTVPKGGKDSSSR